MNLASGIQQHWGEVLLINLSSCPPKTWKVDRFNNLSRMIVTVCLSSVYCFFAFSALCTLLQNLLAPNRKQQIKTMNVSGVIFLYPHMITCLEHTWSSARLACRRPPGRNCGVKPMSKRKSPVVPILRTIQARSDMSEVPKFSATQLVWLMTTDRYCPLFVVYQ